MLDGIRRHVYHADVVVVYKDGAMRRSIEFLKKLSQPRHLCHSIGNVTILNL